MAEEVKRYRELIDAPGFSSVYEFSTGRYVLASDHDAAISRAEALEKRVKELELLRDVNRGVEKLLRDDIEAFAVRVYGLEGANREALLLLRMIVSDLPANRDWLDPQVERRARSLIDRSLPKEPT